jgi:SAM-dependent methyltransferase
MMRAVSFWEERVLPILIEKACRSHEILEDRRRVVPRAQGDVLEVGVGSGLNLAFYDPARVTRVTGVDPSAALLARARPRAAAARVPVELVRGQGEALPFDAARFDAAVITYTLCSVDDPAAVVAELRRVLRPGAALYFVEHGRAPDAGPRRWQARINPLWRRVSGGCTLDRDVTEPLRAEGFAVEELAAGYDPGPRWLSYTYRGVARAT